PSDRPGAWMMRVGDVGWGLAFETQVLCTGLDHCAIERGDAAVVTRNVGISKLLFRIATCMSVLLFAGIIRADDQGVNSLARVLEAWRARQRRVQCFDFSWKGTVFRRLDEPRILIEGMGGTRPPKESTFPIVARVLLDTAGRGRFEYK